MDPDADRIVVHLKSSSVDTIPLGILRGSTDHTISYLNRAARDLIGPDHGIGTSLEELDFAPGSEGVVQANLEERFATESATTYAVAYVRADLGTRVHVQISGVPEYDDAGTMIGSLGFVTDKTMDHANLAIHEAIGTASDWRGLLETLADSVRGVIAFDSMVINLISADRSALRVLFERPKSTSSIVPAWRWWPMPAFVAADIDSLVAARPDDIRQMFSKLPYSKLAAEDPATQAWLSLDYRHMLRKPVKLGKSAVSMVGLFRFGDQPFTEAEVQRLDQLPISETVNIALALEHRSELEFALQLISELSEVAQGVAEVGRVLVGRIKTHFEWEHVSLFRVNYDDRTVSIVDQAAEPSSRLATDYRQSVDEGLLGKVVQSRQSIRIGDVHHCDGYLEGIATTNSEMCLPIPGDRVRWILNVESTLGSAFASEEQAAVERLLEIAGLILDRTLALEFNKTVLECVADAVIQTTANGSIQYVNPACATLLKRGQDSLQGLHLSTLFSSPDGNADAAKFVAELMSFERVLPRIVNFGIDHHEPIPVLLSGNALPPQIGGKVFVASDLRYRQQVQRMDALQDVFRQVASESRVPLALASSFLQELQERGLDAESLGLVDKAICQLRRADLPLERVVRLAATTDGQELPLQPMSLDEVAGRLMADLPETYRRKVMVASEAADAYALAARPELDFCVASVVAFLLRMKAQRDGIELRLKKESGERVLDFRLVDPLAKSPSATRLQAKSEHERDFSLAEPVIQSLMQRMRGRFEVSQKDGLSLRLVLAPSEVE